MKYSHQISVVMPVYNTKECFLREAIESILNQTYDNFKLMIVDDCSTTNTIDIIKSYDDKRIVLLQSQKNLGAAAARNLALNQIDEEFIAFLDSDDIALPQRLEKQIDYLQKNPSVGLVGTSYIELPYNKIQSRITDTQDLKDFVFFQGCPFCQSTVMLRKSLLETHHIRYREDTIPAEDYALWVDLMEVANFTNMQDVLVKYRWHDDNLSRTQAIKQSKMHYKIQSQKWTNMFSLNAEQEKLLIKLFSLKPLEQAEYPVLESLLTQVLQNANQQNLIRESSIKSFLAKLYMKILRKNKSKETTRKMLASNIPTLLNIGILFRIKILFKTFF